eukprot:15365217-Ditylum_brightwellii.AAC.1
MRTTTTFNSDAILSKDDSNDALSGENGTRQKYNVQASTNNLLTTPPLSPPSSPTHNAWEGNSLFMTQCPTASFSNMTKDDNDAISWKSPHLSEE